ncbi:MAG: hypothetical protein V3S14_00190, partial [Anaerolineae bacterium]
TCHHFQTPWTQSYIVFVFTKQVQVLFLALLFDGKSRHFHSRQVQQIAQSFYCHRLYVQTTHSLLFDFNADNADQYASD